MTDTPDWADEIVGKVFEDASGMIGEMTDCAQALRDITAEKDKEIERLRELLEEAAADLSIQCDHDHQSRHTYPDEMRRWKRDMDLVYRIKDAIRNQDTAK